MALAPIDAAGNAAIGTVELRTSPQVCTHPLQYTGHPLHAAQDRRVCWKYASVPQLVQMGQSA